MKTFVLLLIGLFSVVFGLQLQTAVMEPGQFLISGIKNGQPVDMFNAKYDDNFQKRGWRELWITPHPNVSHFTDNERAYAAGYAEGYVTRNEVMSYLKTIEMVGLSQVWHNNATRQKIANWIENSHSWAATQVKNNPSDLFWQNVGYIHQQIEGIAAGVNAATGRNVVTPAQIRFSNGFPDALDIVNVVAPEKRTPWLNMTKEAVLRKWAEISHCSAFIKPQGGETFAAHTTWIFYSMLIRIYKHIEIPFSQVPNAAVSFSSYPGQVSSADDFYMTNNLIVIETTNSVFNHSLYDLCTTQSLLCYTRTVLANRLARTPKEWGILFGKYNSGTYNDQWMVVSSKDQTLGIVEQIPGLVESHDQTQLLKQQGYWPSYNIPFYKTVYDLSGYPQMVEKYGNEFSYENCPRANIFRRNQTMINSIEDVKRLMRYNNYQNDPLSLGNPGFAISSRFDLAKENAIPMGGIDSKVTDTHMSKNRMAFAQCGPTHDQQAPFSWKNSGFEQWPQLDQPVTFDFDFFLMNPHE